MDIINKEIDGGKAFDWGRASSDYAKFRDIYPPIFYNKVVERGLCIKGQKEFSQEICTVSELTGWELIYQRVR